MPKSQKLKRNLFYFFFLINITICFSAFSNESTQILNRADSLFQQKKFTEAFTLYSQLDNSGISTPSMYLKMAYISEALKNVSETLYYLDKYYLLSKNKIALKKMEDLATHHQLIGYDYSDVEFAENLIRNYGRFINYWLIGILLVLVGILFYQKFKRNNVNRYLAIIIVCIDLVLISNGIFFITKNYGIIESNNSYIMNAPSSGAELLTTLNGGNKFDIKHYDDIWSKINFEGDNGFIRTNDLLIIHEKQSPILWLIDNIQLNKK